MKVSSRGEQGAVRPAVAAGAAGSPIFLFAMDGWCDRRGAVAVAAATEAEVWGRCRQHPARRSAWTILSCRLSLSLSNFASLYPFARQRRAPRSIGNNRKQGDG
jgi:hypothetical protein